MQVLCSAVEARLVEKDIASLEVGEKEDNLKERHVIKRCTSAWSAQQDSQLINLMKCHGAGKWKMIAKLLDNKSPKQCRDRW